MAESGCSHCILRIEWSYGKHGIDFITKMLNAAKKRDVLKVVDDQVGSPTHTVEVAKVILDLLQMATFPSIVKSSKPCWIGQSRPGRRC
ncbi:MAG: hypothetical protein B6I25_08120 [Planctomycetales bacterium 4572_13]|nr:MAG: hypothetical protein B6I25_08120 [Planctomycetales bacterium 4572_13]